MVFPSICLAAVRKIEAALVAGIGRKTIGVRLGVTLFALGSLAAPAQTPAPPPGPPPPLSVDFPLPPLSDAYGKGPDSLPQPGVPKGKIITFHLTDSKIFPGSDQTIKVYIPAEYTGDKPACVFVFFGGMGPSDTAPVVFDNLIAQHALPVMLAVGISPAHVASSLVLPPGTPPDPPNMPSWWTDLRLDPRYERSMELDSMSDRTPRFVIDEVLPAVERQKTPDGKPILISSDPNDRAIGGSSTSAIGAFNVAWHRPDAFHRVFTSIGTFVDCRGGERFANLVRKSEPKPLKIYMEDGVNDECGPVLEMGDWALSNQTLLSALTFAGYDVTHMWGAGGHNNAHAAAIFPDVVKWLWKDYPTPITAKPSSNVVLKHSLLPDAGWQVAADGLTDAGHLAVDPQGDVFFQDQGKGFKIGADGKAQDAPGPVLAFGPDGKSYGAETVPGLTNVQGMTVTNKGDIYAVTGDPAGPGELWLVQADGRKTRLDGDIKGPAGLAPTANGLWLFVAQNRSRWGLSYRIETDGTADLRENYFYDFWVSDSADDSGARDICMDTTGQPYAATRMGVQIFDRNGRLTAILPLPNEEEATSVCFGGPKFDTLYVSCAGKVYQRKMKTTGAPPWSAPVTLPHWGEG